MNRLTSGKLFFPVNSFRTPDKLSDSVNDAESHDRKKIVRIPFPVLEILIKISNCVGSTYVRGWFLMKVRLIGFYHSPVIWDALQYGFIRC